MANNNRTFLALIGQPLGATGRAKKYLGQEHCDLVRDLAQAGEFPEAWAAEMGITLTTMRMWVKTHEEFRESIIIARLLLQTYWTREIVKARNLDTAKPGIYSLIVRRFPELYGRTPHDLWAYLHGQDETTAAPGQGQQNPITNEAVRTMSDADLATQLETLRKRAAEMKE